MRAAMAMRAFTVIHLTTVSIIRSAMASMPSTVHGPIAAMRPAMRCDGYGQAGAGGKERSGSAIKRWMRSGVMTPASVVRLEVKRPGKAMQKQPRPANHGCADGKQVSQPGSTRTHAVTSRQAGRRLPAPVARPGFGRRPGAASPLLHNGSSATSRPEIPSYFLVCSSAGVPRKYSAFHTINLAQYGNSTITIGFWRAFATQLAR